MEIEVLDVLRIIGRQRGAISGKGDGAPLSGVLVLIGAVEGITVAIDAIFADLAMKAEIADSVGVGGSDVTKNLRVADMDGLGNADTGKARHGGEESRFRGRHDIFLSMKATVDACFDDFGVGCQQKMAGSSIVQRRG